MTAKPGRHPLWHPFAATIAVVAMLFPLHLLGLLAMLALDLLTGRVSSAELSSAPRQVLDALIIDKSVGLIVGVTATGIVLGYAGLRLAATPAIPPERHAVWKRLRLVSPRGRDILLASVGLLSLSSMLDGIAALLTLEMGGTMELLKEVVAPPWTQNRLVLAVFLGVIPGVAEELYFRGYLLTKLELASGRWVALFLSAVLFGLFHVDPVHSSLTFFMGLYMGICVLLTGSLWVGMAAHVLNNAIAVMLAGLDLADPALDVAVGAFVSFTALFFLIRGSRRPWPSPSW